MWWLNGICNTALILLPLLCTQNCKFCYVPSGNTIAAQLLRNFIYLKDAAELGHLAYYITKGEISANEFLPPEKIDNIIRVSKKLDTFQFGPIKQALGDEYSYGDIKIAIASYLATSKEK